jgi:nickel transport protein
MKKVIIIYLFLIFPFTTFHAHAHRVTIFAWVDGDTVHTQSKFGGGKLVNNGEINVFDPEGTLLLKGHTDENGEFSFKVPKKTSLRIELNAGLGHQNEWIVHGEEIAGLEQDKLTVLDQLEKSNGFLEAKTDTPVLEGITKEDIEQAVDQALEKKLKPVMQMLSDLSDPGPGISDILGGIGYIIGLVGIGVYFKNRKKADSDTR